MAEKVITALVEGGKATAGPPLGPALGPMGINAGKVVAEINQKTKQFEGVTVPVKVIINPVTKDFRIEIGSPPISALIKKELELQKGSGKAKDEKVGDVPIDLIIKLARAKESSILARSPQRMVKEVLGACVSMGIIVDGKDPREVQKEVDAGLFDDKILGRVELHIDKEALKKKQAELLKVIEEKHKVEEAAKAAEIAAKAAAPVAGAPGTAPAGAAMTAEAKPEDKKLSKKALKAAVELEKKAEAEQ